MKTTTTTNPTHRAIISAKVEEAVRWAHFQKWTTRNVTAFVAASVTVISRANDISPAIVRAAFQVAFPEVG